MPLILPLSREKRDNLKCLWIKHNKIISVKAKFFKFNKRKQ